ncbi:hypothetical protein QJQ45_006414 [Haematococcus lacustris]|nr:hypothetical protein QJQ45_006414 [Haematococcus lacustris]
MLSVSLLDHQEQQWEGQQRGGLGRPPVAGPWWQAPGGGHGRHPVTPGSCDVDSTSTAGGDSAGTDQAFVQRGNARRAVMSFLAAGWLASAAAPASAEGVASDLARRVLRPADLDEVQAVVALLDARSTLRDIAALAATGPESKERFDGRKLWPAYARWLREAGPAAPTVARLVTGSTDGEDTLSEMYGGKAELPGATDAVYRGLGRVLTISGRTIRPEAQESPEAALEAKAALDTFLAKVPQQVYEQAMAFRVARAQKLGQQ